MTAQSGRFRAWCARVWRCVLHTTQTMAAYDLTGQCTGGWPPQYPDIPVEWAHCATLAVPDLWWALNPAAWGLCTQWAHKPPAVLTEATQLAATDRLTVLTPSEQDRLRMLRDRCQANRTLLTAPEFAQLHFVRWLHQTGRIAG